MGKAEGHGEGQGEGAGEDTATNVAIGSGLACGLVVFTCLCGIPMIITGGIFITIFINGTTLWSVGVALLAIAVLFIVAGLILIILICTGVIGSKNSTAPAQRGTVIVNQPPPGYSNQGQGQPPPYGNQGQGQPPPGYGNQGQGQPQQGGSQPGAPSAEQLY